MNQPKFKFGEEVRNTPKSYISRRFFIGLIEKRDDGFWYAENSNSSFHREDVLILLDQEPQKKKLYAYECDGFIYFKKIETDFHPTDQENYHANFEHVYRRASEYDIEYPGEKDV